MNEYKENSSSHILFNFLKTKVTKKFWKQEGRKEISEIKIILMLNLSETVSWMAMRMISIRINRRIKQSKCE